MLIKLFLLFGLFSFFTNISFARGGGHSYSSSRSSYGPKSYSPKLHYSTRETHVRAYVKKNGTYVQSHYRTKSNKTKRDNWSTKGNVNPHTGKIGSKNIDEN